MYVYTFICMHVLFIVEGLIHVEPPIDPPVDEPPNKNPEMDETDGSSIEEGEQIINISFF